MQSNEKRVSILEVKTGDDRLRLVTLPDGESCAEALAHMGFSPDLSRVLFISPLDLNL